MIFKRLAGRCLFMSNDVTVSKNWSNEELGLAPIPYCINLLGIGPEDIVAGDVIVRFTKVEQSLFFRPGGGRHQVLGDGHFTVLPTFLKYEFRDRQAEIVLV